MNVLQSDNRVAVFYFFVKAFGYPTRKRPGLSACLDKIPGFFKIPTLLNIRDDRSCTRTDGGNGMDAFQDCIKKRRLWKVAQDEEAARRALLEAIKEIRVSVKCFSTQELDAALENTYFSIIHAAEAILRHHGYQWANLFALTA